MYRQMVGAAYLAVIMGVASACSETTPNATPQPTAQTLRTGSQADEGACERAVSIETSNGDVVTLSSEFSQANTVVIVGVGPQRAQWRCLVSGGKVAEVMSLTNEGKL
jgi:hypothetical protein